jgi:2-pyrone-4,6-dicarboxylate lactonase
MSEPDTPSLSVQEQSVPLRVLPKSTCDAHAHISGPASRFPLAATAAYAPPDAPVEAYIAMQDRLGLARGVLVQAASYGFDNSALIDALGRFPQRLRGVALAGSETSDAELEALAAAGVKGLRFAHYPPGVKDLGGVGLDQIAKLAPRMRALGLHAQIWAPCAASLEVLPELLRAGVPAVLDHMARISPAAGLEDSAFQRLLQMLAHEDIWVKLIPHRVTQHPLVFDDLRRFAEAFLRAAPERMLWGSDWPFVRMGDATPDAGKLADLVQDWAGDTALCQRVFVDNPIQLYGFDGAAA